ncbi:MAG: chromosomal replication initiator protein DnaA [Candidatus Babeliales bacterium]|nr:chromosomal replication initiator protein DnaA [Candidatus Babeliales bacterium]
MLVSIWQAFLNIVRQEIGSQVVETWLKAVTLVKWDSLEEVVHIQAPNAFVKDWIRTQYLDLFKLHLSRLLNVDNLTIIFVEQSEKIVTTVTKVQNLEDPKAAHESKQELSKSLDTRVQLRPVYKSKDHINSNYQFETFVVGPSNSLAYAASYAVTKNPGVLYNPLFIYGSSGLGKTHLLHAIGNEIKKQYKKSVVLYQTADRFVNEFINAIRFDKIHAFKEKYKDIDVLLIDDVQFISNKEQTQEAFFHIFNNLFEASKQIVISSDVYPSNLEGIAQRLRSRLEGGLITDIHMPMLETKIAILKRKAELNNEIISDDVLNFIASRVETNVRELEGLLIRVFAFSNLTNQPITLDLAQRVLGVVKQKNTTIGLQEIAKIIHKNFSYNLSDLQSKSRNKELSFARQVAMYLMKKNTEKSLLDIGEFLGRKDHSTISHGINKIQKLRELDLGFDNKLKQLEYELSH